MDFCMFNLKCKTSCFCMGLSTFRKFMGGGGWIRRFSLTVTTYSLSFQFHRSK